MSSSLNRFSELCKFRYMGLGFLWAWIYCLWFSPAVFPTRNGIGVNESPSWLLSCITVMVTMLVVPLTLRRTNRTLESFLQCASPHP